MMTREEAITILIHERDEDLFMRTEYRKRIHEALTMGIKALEQTRWISVSERLPNLDDYAGSKVWQKIVLITGYFSFDDAKDLFVSEAFAKDVTCNSVHDTVVVAWMPLPLSYKAESEVEK